jgi:hypothetical protein
MQLIPIAVLLAACSKEAPVPDKTAPSKPPVSTEKEEDKPPAALSNGY